MFRSKPTSSEPFSHQRNMGIPLEPPCCRRCKACGSRPFRTQAIRLRCSRTPLPLELGADSGIPPTFRLGWSAEGESTPDFAAFPRNAFGRAVPPSFHNSNERPEPATAEDRSFGRERPTTGLKYGSCHHSSQFPARWAFLPGDPDFRIAQIGPVEQHFGVTTALVPLPHSCIGPGFMTKVRVSPVDLQHAGFGSLLSQCLNHNFSKSI